MFSEYYYVLYSALYFPPSALSHHVLHRREKAGRTEEREKCITMQTQDIILYVFNVCIL